MLNPIRTNFVLSETKRMDRQKHGNVTTSLKTCISPGMLPFIYQTTRLHFQKFVILIFTVVKTSDLIIYPLNMATPGYSETLVRIYQSTRRHILEDRTLCMLPLGWGTKLHPCTKQTKFITHKEGRQRQDKRTKHEWNKKQRKDDKEKIMGRRQGEKKEEMMSESWSLGPPYIMITVNPR
jgi:hypothetical protein